MDAEEWNIAQQLCTVLKVSLIILIHLSSSFILFRFSTLFFLHDGTPNITTVIPMMDQIDEVLTTNALDK